MFREHMEEGRIYQTIITTGFHTVNAASIGIKREGERLRFRLFEGSDTYGNLKVDRRFCVHLVPRGKEHLLVEAALTGWGDRRPEFGGRGYGSFNGIPFIEELDCRFYCRVDIWDDVDVKDEVGTSKAADVVAGVFLDESSMDVVPIGHLDSDVVETAVWATRWKAAPEGNREPLLARTLEYLESARKKRKNKPSVQMIMDFLKR